VNYKVHNNQVLNERSNKYCTIISKP
jgi:hypothetical protein